MHTLLSYMYNSRLRRTTLKQSFLRISFLAALFFFSKLRTETVSLVKKNNDNKIKVLKFVKKISFFFLIEQPYQQEIGTSKEYLDIHLFIIVDISITNKQYIIHRYIRYIVSTQNLSLYTT